METIKEAKESRVEQAVRNMKSGYSCSQAVLCAYREEAGLSMEEAKRRAAPYSGGAKIKCGAVLAAELVFGGRPDAEKLSLEMEKRFKEKNSSVICRELRGEGGKRLRSCLGCVEDSAAILEELIRNYRRP